MQKLGVVVFRDNDITNKSFVAYYSNEINLMRIDIYTDPSTYDPVSGLNMQSAYLNDGKEYYYGDDTLCLRVNKCISKVAIAPGKTEKEFETSAIGVEFTTTKTGEDVFHKMKTINGEIVEEIYATGDCEIHFSSISPDATFAIRPLAFGLYAKYGDISDLIRDDLSTSSLEYYTLDELKSRYPGQLDHLNDYDMVVVDNMAQAWDRLTEFKHTVSSMAKRDDDVVVSIDIETTGLGMGLFGDDCITGIVLASTETWSTYFPFRQEGCTYNLPMWFLHEVADAVNNLPSNVRVGTYNGKMEQSGFIKDKDFYIKYCDYAKTWKDTGMQNLFIGQEEIQQDDERYLASKYYQRFMAGEPVNNDLYIRDDVDGLHISIKLDQRRMKGLHTLKTQATKVTGKFWLELHNIFKGDIKFNKLPPDLITAYACPDPCNTIRVIKALEAKFPSSEKAVLDIENKLNEVKTINEFYGMRTDAYKLENLIRQQEYMRDMLERRFKEIHKTSKNIRSPDVKAAIFYNQLKAEVVVRTKTGKPSASNSALKAILEVGAVPKDKRKPKEEWPPDISVFVKEDGNPTTWDKLTPAEQSLVKKENARGVKEQDKTIKVRTAVTGEQLASNRYPSLLILDAYNKLCKEVGALKRIKKKSHRDRVSFYITSDGADSDRQTSDAHQYSDTMKGIILADTDEHYLISCDYSQVEIRVLAYVTGEEELTKLLTNPDVDGHRAILQRISGKEMYLISNEERGKKKAVNFGVIYGMTEYGLARSAHGAKYTREQLLENLDAITAFYNGLPKVKEKKINVEKSMLEKGQVQTVFGYIRYFKHVLDPECTKQDISKAKKAAFNTCIQGFAATVMKVAENNYQEYIKAKGWDECVEVDGVHMPKVRLMLSIHDEVLISAHKSIPMPEIIEMCKVCQEIEIKDAPPLFACPAFVDSWYEAKDPAYEIPVRLRDEIVRSYKEDGVDLITGKDYLQIINNYRDNQIRDYMESLIAEYKTPEAVAENVKDPYLTHELVKRYIKKSEKMSHEERIINSVHRFMDGMDITSMDDSVIEVEFKDTYIDDNASINEYMYFNEKGEQIIEYDEDYIPDEEDDISTVPTEFDIQYKELEEDYVIYTMKECIIDMTNFAASSTTRAGVGELVHQSINNVFSNNPGEYKVVYMVDGKLHPTRATVNYVPDKINYAIKTACLKEVS